MRRRLACLFTALAAAPAAHALEALATYDKFSGTTINTDRWQQAEFTREVVDGKLHVAGRTVASKTTNSGSTFQSQGLSVAEPETVTALGATVTVNDIGVARCAANTDAGWVAARVSGSFFNVGTPTAGSLVGDVIAQARVMRTADSTDPDGTLKVTGLIVQCLTADCNGSSGAKTLKSIDLGTVTVGTPVKLSVRWDAAQHKFYLRRDSNAAKSYAYTVSDRAAPGTPYKALQVRGSVENCKTGEHAGWVDAVFDNATVNASAAP